MDGPALVSGVGLVKSFALSGSRGALRAVDGVDLGVHAGESLGIVGESGCGKTTLARMLVGLYAPDGGRLCWQGRDVASLRSGERLAASRDIQMVFQDPNASLNPRKTVQQIVAGPLVWQRVGTRASREARVHELLAAVGLPADALGLRPHAFSGGQRQRIGIARALALQPRLLVLDEPTSALDVSVQAQVLNLLARLREQLRLALVLISHDLRTVGWLCDRVAVMQRGRIVEIGTAEQVFRHPQHPCTQALLAALPRGEPAARPVQATPIDDARRPGAPAPADSAENPP